MFLGSLVILTILAQVPFLAVPTNAADSENRIEDRLIGPYRIEIFDRPKETKFGNQVLRISREGQVLATVEDYQLSLDPNQVGIEDDQITRPRFGENVTGNGIPDLVVYAFNNNAYLFSTLHIFELGSEFRKIYDLDEWVYGFKKIGEEPDWKIFLGDEAGFEGWGHVWYGIQVIMTFDAQAHRYRMAMALMRKPPPTVADLAKTAKEIRDGESWKEVPESFMMTRALLDLAYSGNGQYVDRLLDLAWNPKFPGKAKFRAQLFECKLRKSSWWPELAEFNGWPAFEPSC